MSMGLYVLPTGGGDPQSPHTEDEVYYVVSGRGEDSKLPTRTAPCRRVRLSMWRRTWSTASIRSKKN
ncbi:MAG: cupin domain-containing protein [Ignavibacteriales bacterium]|nr:cupin domain-containing protein [Ignavibacteriales bacterium]